MLFLEFSRDEMVCVSTSLVSEYCQGSEWSFAFHLGRVRNCELSERLAVCLAYFPSLGPYWVPGGSVWSPVTAAVLTLGRLHTECHGKLM